MQTCCLLLMTGRQQRFARENPFTSAGEKPLCRGRAKSWPLGRIYLERNRKEKEDFRPALARAVWIHYLNRDWLFKSLQLRSGSTLKSLSSPFLCAANLMKELLTSKDDFFFTLWPVHESIIITSRGNNYERGGFFLHLLPCWSIWLSLFLAQGWSHN